MRNPSGQRSYRYLLAVLTITVSPLIAHAEIKMAPVVDLNPRHNEPASKELEEPKSLVVAAKAIPLSNVTGKAMEARPSSKLNANVAATPGNPQPAVQLVAPFDPTKSSKPKANNLAKVIELPPVIKVHEPIKPKRPETSAGMSVAKSTESPKALKPASVAPIAIPVDRRVFVATRGDRLERAFGPHRPLLPKRDRVAKQLLATLSEMTAERHLLTAPNVEPPTTIAVAEPNQPKNLSGFIQVAQRDPIAKQSSTTVNEQESVRLARVRKTAVVQVVRPAIGFVAKQETPQQQPKAIVEPTDVASSDSVSEDLDVGNAIIQRTPVVELAAQPLLDQQQEVEASENVEAMDNSDASEMTSLSESDQVAEASKSSDEHRDEASSEQPFVTLTEATPFLASLQEQSPSASDLPAPAVSEHELSEEEIAEAEEIAAFDLDLKPIQALSANTRPESGEMPKNYAATRFKREGQVAHRMGFSRANAESEMMWEAPAICHQPLYFEDINLERHGYKIPLFQPAVSMAHFFGRVPLLPYMMSSEGHRDCQYTLGHYRPGDYAPYSLYVPRFRLGAASIESAVVTGLLFAIP